MLPDKIKSIIIRCYATDNSESDHDKRKQRNAPDSPGRVFAREVFAPHEDDGPRAGYGVAGECTAFAARAPLQRGPGSPGAPLQQMPGHLTLLQQMPGHLTLQPSRRGRRSNGGRVHQGRRSNKCQGT